MSGYDLVTLIFAREIDDDLTGLVKRLDKRLDETMTRHKRQSRFGVFVILLSDDASQHQKLKDLAAKGELKQVVLSAFANKHGPPRYQVAKEADLTVAVYRDHAKVSANFALKTPDLTQKKADAIFEAVTKVLPK